MTRVLTDQYIEQEEAQKRKPIELFHFWRDGFVGGWRYTSADKTINYNGNNYTPITISRGTVKYDAEFETTSCLIKIGYTTDPVVDYISQNPVELIWVDIRRYYEDITVGDKATGIFIGQIEDSKIQGNAINAKAVGFEHYLNKKIPKFRFQVGCNNDLFDDLCVGIGTLDENNFKAVATVSAVDEDGVVLTSSTFGTYDNGYFTRGKLYWGDYRRMIVDHTGNDITIRFNMPGFTAGQSVTVYAGCDKQIDTCIDKFDNKDQFFGHFLIPLDNPATWKVGE